jgi:hypothetical protein
MKSKENYLKRIEAIQTFFMNNPRSKFVDVMRAFPDTPSGTISATMSFMYQVGHLTRNDYYEYSVPSVLSTSKQIAGDISKMLKRKNEAKLKEPKPSDLFNAPSNFENALSIQKRIEQAIELLKSQGYKILAKKTEYTEI